MFRKRSCKLAENEKLLSVKCEDGYKLDVMLTIPEKTEKIVIYVNGSGPMTYRTMRQKPDGSLYSYHQFFADELTKRNILYCRYSTRGVTDGKKSPGFCNINEKDYKTYLPMNSVSDIECIIRYLHEKEGYSCPVYLMGWSEGTIISAIVASRNNVKVDGIFLAGYCNENLKDTFTWQMMGNSSITQYRRLFDYDKKGYICKADFEADKYNVRKAVFGDMTFEKLDKNGDGKLTAEDFAAPDYIKATFSAVEKGDDKWLAESNGVRLTSDWWKAHFALPANKNTLPGLDLPIHIFAGDFDSMTPQSQARDIERVFKEKGKTNLTVHYLENHDHDLNYTAFSHFGKVSEGMKELFDTIENMK
ncbi:MAG: alpha/beta hydrolase [Clostridia bacterium]|nr:alpha/beta hydrolase [Clostridia bacterium]